MGCPSPWAGWPLTRYLTLTKGSWIPNPCQDPPWVPWCPAGTGPGHPSSESSLQAPEKAQGGNINQGGRTMPHCARQDPARPWAPIRAGHPQPQLPTATSWCWGGWRRCPGATHSFSPSGLTIWLPARLFSPFSANPEQKGGKRSPFCCAAGERSGAWSHPSGDSAVPSVLASRSSSCTGLALAHLITIFFF